MSFFLFKVKINPQKTREKKTNLKLFSLIFQSEKFFKGAAWKNEKSVIR